MCHYGEYYLADGRELARDGGFSNSETERPASVHRENDNTEGFGLWLRLSTCEPTVTLEYHNYNHGGQHNGAHNNTL